MHWRRKWKPPPVFLPEESQGWGTRPGPCGPCLHRGKRRPAQEARGARGARPPPSRHALYVRAFVRVLLQPWPRAQPLFRASYPPFATQQVRRCHQRLLGYWDSEPRSAVCGSAVLPSLCPGQCWVLLPNVPYSSPPPGTLGTAPPGWFPGMCRPSR